MEDAFSLFFQREGHELGENSSQHLACTDTSSSPNCQKSLFEVCDTACGTGHLSVDAQPGKESLDPEEGRQKSTQTWGLPRKIDDTLFKLRPSSCCVTQAVPM